METAIEKAGCSQYIKEEERQFLYDMHEQYTDVVEDAIDMLYTIDIIFDRDANFAEIAKQNFKRAVRGWVGEAMKHPEQEAAIKDIISIPIKVRARKAQENEVL